MHSLDYDINEEVLHAFKKALCLKLKAMMQVGCFVYMISMNMEGKKGISEENEVRPESSECFT